MNSRAIQIFIACCLWGAWMMHSSGQDLNKAKCCENIAAYRPSQIVRIEDWNPETRTTVVEMYAEELQQRYSELSSLKFNLDQGDLDFMLKKVGDNTEVFFRELVNIACKEDVQFKIDSWKINDQKLHKEFSYLILPRRTGLPWTEDRTDMNGDPVQIDPNFCISKGFALSCIYLHPDHQKGSAFRYLGRDKKGSYVLAFAQKPEAKDYLAGFVNTTSEKAMEFLVQGFVWLKEDNYQITRMKTCMLLPGRTLKEQTTDISYQETRFDKTPQSFWLPKAVTITWSFPKMTCKNQHKYSDFRLFSVETDYKIDTPQPKK
jgi:hypothetical protein